jgi:hypothetical protein
MESDVMTKTYFASRAGKAAIRITIAGFSLLLGSCASGAAAPKESLPDLDVGEVGSNSAAAPTAVDEAPNSNKDLYRCPVEGDELYLVVNHNVMFQFSDLSLNHILFTQKPIRLAVEDFPERLASKGEVFVGGAFEDCCTHITEGSARDCSAQGEGSMSMLIDGYCMDGVVHLEIEEAWSEYTLDVCGAKMPYPEADYDQGEKIFPLSEAWTSVGAVVESPFAMGDGMHSWTLFVDLAQAESVTEDLTDSYSFPNVPLVPQSEISDSE